MNKTNGSTPATKRPKSAAIKVPERFAGEPPSRFPYDREILADVMAWATASPNFYYGHDEVAYSRDRYIIVLDPGMKDVPQERRVRPDLKPGRDAEPLGDPEDTEEVLKRYLSWRTRYKRLNMDRQLLDGEPRPGPVTSIATAQNAHPPATKATPLWQMPKPNRPRL